MMMCCVSMCKSNIMEQVLYDYVLCKNVQEQQNGPSAI